jgi:hypothetical protein
MAKDAPARTMARMQHWIEKRSTTRIPLIECLAFSRGHSNEKPDDFPESLFPGSLFLAALPIGAC